MKVVLIGAGKGGTGKTTVTSLLGKALSEKYRVALLDLDTCGPNLPRIVGIQNGEAKFDQDWFYAEKYSETLEVFSPAFLVPAGVAIAWSGNQRKELIHELLQKVKWNRPDILLCDCPPGTADEILAVLQYVPHVDGAVIVTTGKRESLDDARRLISLLQNHIYNVNIIGVVENMAYIENGESSIALFSDGVDIGAELGFPVIAKIPWRERIMVDDGFRQIADVVALKLELDGKGV